MTTGSHDFGSPGFHQRLPRLLYLSGLLQASTVTARAAYGSRFANWRPDWPIRRKAKKEQSCNRLPRTPEGICGDPWDPRDPTL